MKKGQLYFSHDYSANADYKIELMRQDLGMEGYGIYWFIIEKLAEAGGVLPTKIIPILATKSGSSEVKVRGVIEQYELFQIKDEGFFSLRLLSHFEYLEKQKEYGKKGAEMRKKLRGANRDPKRGANRDPSAINKGNKGNKGNKIKEINKEEVVQFFSVLDLGEELKKESQYLESFMMNRRLDQKSMEKIIDEFVQYKIQTGEGETTSGAFKKHLTNWINYKDFKNMKNGRKRPQIQIMPS